MLVREAERARDLERELDRLLLRERPAPFDQRLQVLAVDELEDDVLAAVLLAAVDHRDDVRVREPRDGARLTAEALDVLPVVPELVVQDLERDVPLQKPVVRSVDARHPAGSDDLLELVAFRDQLADHGESLPVFSVV